MSLLEEKDPRFRNLERKIGVFVVVSVVIVVASLVLISMQRDLFTKQSRLHLYADTGGDLTEGMSVKFKGFRIGRVSAVSLNNSGKVEVTLAINKNHMKFIHTDSRALLVQEGMIGAFIIEIESPSQSSPQIAEGASIEFGRATSMTEVAKELKGKAEVIIEEVQRILQYVSDPKGDVRTAIYHMRMLAEESRKTNAGVIALLDKTKQDLSTLMKDADSIALDIHNGVIPDSRGAIASVQNTIEAAHAMIANIETEAKKSIEKANRSLDNAEAITSNIKRASNTVPSLVTKGNAIAEDTGEVMRAVKGTWPISTHVETPSKDALEADPYAR